ncbi:MAG: patatin-like phospholipase family protein [Chloroflexi bacterium]|nr:patatin-like phospholipase family protein [Chloroflexota bacterium]
MAIRTLILSGGGGRGAFHAGVYKYLQETQKANVDDEHKDAWTPDVVVGTSIGAVNGAAIVQGISAAELERFWLELREHHVEGLPPGMSRLTRFIMSRFFKRAIGVALPRVTSEKSTSPAADEAWPPIPLLPEFIGERLIGRWSNLLDTGPLLESLVTRLGLDEDKINNSDKLLLIEATNIRTGEEVTFCNRKDDVDHDISLKEGITLRRILASCSIPLIYPWTYDTDGEVYWDGAIVANTPLGDALDAVRGYPQDEPMEAVVVLLTPWWELNEAAPARRQGLPSNFGEAITWTLDWALLASFRVSLELARHHNEQVREARASAEEIPGLREANIVIVAPEDFLPVTRIIDYDEPASRQLIDMGYRAAKNAFEKHFAR